MSPPLLARTLDDLPAVYNVATDLLERNNTPALRHKPAVIDLHGPTTYGDLFARVRGFAGLLRDRGIQREQRIILCLADTADFHIAFLGAVWAGVIPVPVNTMLGTADYQWLLDDSRARAVVVSASYADKWVAAAQAFPNVQFLSSDGGPWPNMRDASTAAAAAAPAQTHRDEPAFWLYSSGSTGRPKGVIHSHGAMRLTADLYARGLVGYTASDVVHSVAKLFFAYGLGNSLTFPFSVGATVVLNDQRPVPEAVCALTEKHSVTIFNAVPTFFANLLASMDKNSALRLPYLRRVTSAGECLPASIGAAFRERVGVDILDGLGSTEMLHIFLSQHPDEVQYGVTGRPVRGYECAIVDENSREVGPDEIGELLVKGPTAALGYWNNRPKSLHAFNGAWTRTGDKYSRDAHGWYKYHGRSDDMLKVGGIFVSPIEIEEALRSHISINEVAVVGIGDPSGLIKPKAFVVLREGWHATAELEIELQAHVKGLLAPYKYPYWIEFIGDLPKTATGKVQRYKLRPGQ